MAVMRLSEKKEFTGRPTAIDFINPHTNVSVFSRLVTVTAENYKSLDVSWIHAGFPIRSYLGIWWPQREAASQSTKVCPITQPLYLRSAPLTEWRSRNYRYTGCLSLG